MIYISIYSVECEFLSKERYKLQPMFCILFIFLTLFIVNMTLTSLCLYFYLQYIHNFMNKINKDFEYNKTEFYLNIAILSYNIIYFFTYLFIHIKSSDVCNSQDNLIRNVDYHNIRNENNRNHHNHNNHNRNNRNVDYHNNRNENNRIRHNHNNHNRNNRNLDYHNNQNDNNRYLHNHNNHNRNNYYNSNNSDNNLSIQLVDKNISNKRLSNESITTNNDNLNENDKLCIICCTNPIKVIFLPCRHRTICRKCYKNNIHQFKICPICHSPITSVINKIYDEYYQK